MLCDDPELPSDELISRADRAMYAAKRQGGNLAVVYNENLSDSTRQDFDIEQQLTLALQQGRLALQFQPIVDAKSKRPVLAEALVRMRTEDGRLLGPGHFIDVAERTGQILQIGHWVLQQACWHARRLGEAGMATAISVNVSPRELMHVNYVRNVEAVLEDTGVSPSSIVLEVTETAVMEDVDKAQATLNHLKSLGLRLALDDFGTGYSSISMLKALPFDILKIDRAFVRDVEGMSLGASTLGAGRRIGVPFLDEQQRFHARRVRRHFEGVPVGPAEFACVACGAAVHRPRSEATRQHGGDGCRLGWGGAFFSLSFGHGASRSRFDACSMGVAAGT